MGSTLALLGIALLVAYPGVREVNAVRTRPALFGSRLGATHVKRRFIRPFFIVGLLEELLIFSESRLWSGYSRTQRAHRPLMPLNYLRELVETPQWRAPRLPPQQSKRNATSRRLGSRQNRRLDTRWRSTSVGLSLSLNS